MTVRKIIHSENNHITLIVAHQSSFSHSMSLRLHPAFLQLKRGNSLVKSEKQTHQLSALSHARRLTRTVLKFLAERKWHGDRKVE